MHSKIQRSFGYLIICILTMVYVSVDHPGFNLEQCLKDVLLNHPQYTEPNHCKYQCNEDVKFARFPTEHDEKCTIVVVGGQDVLKMSLRYPKCTLHVYEPVRELVSVLQHETRMYNNRYKNVKVYPFGLEDRKESRLVDKNHVKSVRNTKLVVNNVLPEGMIRLDVVDVLEELKKYTRVDLLDVNCSGCEWRMMPRLYGMFHRFMHVQFSLHNRGEEKSWWYCQIRKELSRTHYMSGGVSTAFMWERWSLFKAHS